MPYPNTPPIVRRLITGSALTYEQVDNNFRYLSQSYAILTGSNYYSGSNNYDGFVHITGSLSNGASVLATGLYSHAEGYLTEAYSDYSHAEGASTLAAGYASHAEGELTATYGTGSHAEGYRTEAYGDYSHAAGYGTAASGSYQFVVGQYNEPSLSQSAFIVGGGSGAGSTKNVLFVHSSSFIISASNIQFQGIPSTGTSNNVVVVDTSSGKLYYTSSDAFIANLVQGNDKQVQFNKLNNLSGSDNFTFDYNTNTLTLIGSIQQGSNVTASGQYSYAGGIGVVATGSYQTAVGSYNKIETGSFVNSLFAVGIGTGSLDRRNGLTITQSGSMILQPLNTIDPTSLKPTWTGVLGELVLCYSDSYEYYFCTWDPDSNDWILAPLFQ